MARLGYSAVKIKVKIPLFLQQPCCGCYCILCHVMLVFVWKLYWILTGRGWWVRLTKSNHWPYCSMFWWPRKKKGDFKHLYLLPEGMRLNRSCPGWDSIALLRHRVLAMSGSMKNVKSIGPGTEPSATLYLTILSVWGSLSTSINHELTVSSFGASVNWKLILHFNSVFPVWEHYWDTPLSLYLQQVEKEVAFVSVDYSEEKS